MRFQHHPDNLIYLNDLCLSLEFFQQQEPDYCLLPRATHRLYVPRDRHLLYSSDNQWSGEVPWDEGDRYLTKIAEYEAAWEVYRATQQLAPLPKTVEEAIATVSDKINNFRSQKEQIGIVWQGHPVQTRPLDINNLNAEVLAAQAGVRKDGEIWRMGDNNNVSLSNAELVEMAAAVRVHIKQCYLTAWQHKTAIDQLSIIDEILNYDFQSGWPS